jgi:hypothetical protein
MSADKKPADAKGAETKTPDEWARETGHMLSLRQVSGCCEDRGDWRHSAASALHGWVHHQYHAGSAIRITRAAYLAALDAVDKHPLVPCRDAIGQYYPHAL